MGSKNFIAHLLVFFLFTRASFLTSAEHLAKRVKTERQENSAQENIYSLFTAAGLTQKLSVIEFEPYKRDEIARLLIKLALNAQFLNEEQVQEAANFLIGTHPFCVNAQISKCDFDKELEGFSVLLAAIMRGSPALVKVLLENYADIRSRTASFHGASCLHAALYNPQKNYLEIIKLLIAWKVSLNVINARGDTPLVVVCSPENYPDLPKRDFNACIKLLIEHGASCDKLSPSGREQLFKLLPSPFEKIAILGHPEFLPTENLAQHWNTNALLYAALQGNFSMIQALVLVSYEDYMIVKAKINATLVRLTEYYKKYQDAFIHSKDAAYKNIIKLLEEQKRYYDQISTPVSSIQAHIPSAPATIINIYTGFMPEYTS